MNAAHLNAVLDAATARALELEPRLVAALEPILARAGRDAAARFRRYATSTVQASAARREADAWTLASMAAADRAGFRPALTAAPAFEVASNSTMVCVMPRPDEAVLLADPDGDPAETLHVTLAYLGEIDGPLEAVRAALAPVAAVHAPLAGVVAGYGQFVTPGGPVGLLLPDVPGLVELRVAATDALVRAGVDYSRIHGFEAHVTVDPDPEPGEAEKMLAMAGLPLHFDSLLIVRGNAEVVELPLVGVPPLTAAGEKPPAARKGRATPPAAATTGDTPPVLGPPAWIPPAADEVVDAEAVVAALRRRTDPIHRAVVETTLAPTLGQPGMTLEEALAYYHSPKAFALNEALRLGKPLTAEQQQVVNTIDAAMAPSDRTLTLYRGVPNSKEVYGQSVPSKMTGKTWKTPGYISTSTERGTADEFAGGIAGEGDRPVVLAINVPKGTPMIEVPAGEYGDQHELLLPRDIRIGFGDIRNEHDPYGGVTAVVHSSALDKGTLSPSMEGVQRGLGISFDVTNPLIAPLFEKTGTQITNIAATTRENARRIIAESYRHGLSIPDTAKAIQEGMRAASTVRATLIARTELAAATNGASLAAARLVSEATGGGYSKTWMTAPGATYPRHELYDGLDGQTVTLDALFQVGDDELDHPGDPAGSPENVCNCRCTMRYSDGEVAEADEG